MRHLTLLLFLVSGTCSAAVLRVDTTFVTSDSVTLSLSYYVPATPAPPRGYPGILCVHGFGGSKETYDYAAKLYAQYGYFVTTYTVRGQGVAAPVASQSGGNFEWFTGDRELQDVSEILSWMRNRPDVDSQHIGMEGTSQGGLTTWGALAHHFPIACAVPIVASPLYSRLLTFHGCYGYTFVSIMYDAVHKSTVHLTPYFGSTLLPLIVADDYDSVETLMIQRDLGPALSSVTVPVYLQCAWYDQIFGTSAVFTAYDSLQGPKKLMMWSSGHAVPGGPIGNLRLLQTLRFYDRWLRENPAETIMLPDSAVLLTDFANTSLTATSNSNWHLNLSNSVEDARFYIASSSELDTIPPKLPVLVSSGYQQNVTNDLTHTFTGPIFDSAYTMLGATAHLRVSSSALKYEANAILYDVDDTGYAQPVSRGALQVRAASIGARTVDYRLDPVLHTFPSGHRLRVRIKFGLGIGNAADEFGMFPYPPQASASDTLISSADEPSYIGLVRYNPIASATNAVRTTPRQHSTLVVYPNPATTSATVRGADRIEVTDVTGRHITSVTDGAIDCSQYPAGVYTLRANNAQLTRLVIVR